MNQLWLPFEGLVKNCPHCYPDGTDNILKTLCEKHYNELNQDLLDIQLEKNFKREQKQKSIYYMKNIKCLK